MSRSRRLTEIAQLLGGRRFSSQEELARALDRGGISVTQATLSRDLRSLGVAKRADGDGSVVRAARPGARSRSTASAGCSTCGRSSTRCASPRTWWSCARRRATRTASGRAIDLADFEGVVGTVAGDDTVLVRDGRRSGRAQSPAPSGLDRRRDRIGQVNPLVATPAAVPRGAYVSHRAESAQPARADRAARGERLFRPGVRPAGARASRARDRRAVLARARRPLR